MQVNNATRGAQIANLGLGKCGVHGVHHKLLYERCFPTRT
jgi:hypothetical protein